MRFNLPLTAVISIAAIAGLLLLLREPPAAREKEELLVFCAAGLQKAVDAVVNDYQLEFPNVEVRTLPGPSGYLLAGVLKGDRGDLFLSADASDIEIAQKQDRVQERFEVAVLTPVVAVRKGNEGKIKSLASLADPRMKVGLGIPDKGPMIGKISKQILEKAGLWTKVNEAVRTRGVFKATVNDLASDVEIGAIDAAILYDGIVQLFPGLVALPIPTEFNASQRATVGVLTTTERPTRALHFARFLTAHDRGARKFREQGFVPVEEDAWADRPRLKLMSGNILRPALDPTIREFEEREGVQIDRNYAGCGTLVSGIRAGDQPDAFFACEQSFLGQVQDRFLPGTNISRTRLVLVVPKGNPAAVRVLGDLVRPGLKVGLANEASALGVLSKRLLVDRGLWDAVQRNIAVQTPTADFLLTFLQVQESQAARLDAVIAYEVNARRMADQIEILDIPEASGPVLQPFAIGRDSHHKQLLARLLDVIQRTESRRRFESSGFAWESTAGGPR